MILSRTTIAILPTATLSKTVYAEDEASWQNVAQVVKAAIIVSDSALKDIPTVYRRIIE